MDISKIFEDLEAHIRNDELFTEEHLYVLIGLCATGSDIMSLVETDRFARCTEALVLARSRLVASKR